MYINDALGWQPTCAVVQHHIEVALSEFWIVMTSCCRIQQVTARPGPPLAEAGKCRTVPLKGPLTS